jgi:hypothetical protein
VVIEIPKINNRCIKREIMKDLLKVKERLLIVSVEEKILIGL